MAAKRTNQFGGILTRSTPNLLSSSLVVFNTKKIGTVKVSIVKRPLTGRCSRQICPFNDVTTQSITTQNLMNRSKWALVEPTINTMKIVKPNDKIINTNELTYKSSKVSSPNRNQFRNIVLDTPWSSNVYNNRLYTNREYGQSLEYHKKKKRKKRRRCYGDGDYCYCSWSLLRMFLILIALILLGTIIAAIVIGVSITGRTTSTSTTSISTSTVTTSTSTTATTTTTTAYICNSTCLNQTWQSSSNLLSEWLFDETFNDQRSIYNATSTNNVSFTSNGYIQQAAVFTVNAHQMLTAPYMALAYTSFTIETWIYITGLSVFDHSIFGLCPVASSHQCLHLTIRQISSNYYLYFGFYSDDCRGSTTVTLNTWIHAGFVFDMINMTQFVYLNGIIDMTCPASSALTITSGSVTIGYIPALPTASANNYFQGYIDQITVLTRAKSSCEILEDATLAAYFTFDNGLLLNDSGPNSLPTTTQSTSITSSGHFAQAITFSGASSSYFQINDLTTLGISNRSFSISLWIRPTSLSGVLVHVSSNTSGLGWCLPFIGFATNGSIVAQILNTNGIISVLSPSIPVVSSTWLHIVQTWSSTNGLRLYIDNILVASRISLATTYTASIISSYVTLGNSRDGGTCSQGQIGALTPYQGDIDDFRIYSRELSASDICTLYTT